MPHPGKVEAISNFPKPSNIKGMSFFWYGQLLPSFYAKSGRNHGTIFFATSSKSRPTESLEWTNEMSTAFPKTETILTNKTVLHFHTTDTPITLTTDASDKAVGGVVEQRINGVGQPLAFFSRQLQKAKLKYSTFDRKLLAIYLSIWHFRYYLEGRDFIILTDQKPLSFAMAKTSEPWSDRQQRNLSYSLEFSTGIRRQTENLVADALPRSNINSLLSGVDYAAQQDAKWKKNLRISPNTSLKLGLAFALHQNLHKQGSSNFNISVTLRKKVSCFLFQLSRRINFVIEANFHCDGKAMLHD